MAELTCPYVGLRPYTRAEGRFFFGREEETRRLLDRLGAAPLTLLHGACGVGKSSLLRAGLSAALATGDAGEPGDRPEPVAVYLDDWQGDALRRLRTAVDESLPDARLPAGEGARLADWLEAVARRHKVELFVLLDQFEEYFVHHDGDAAHEPFARQLAEAVRRPGLPARFLIAIRDDALFRLDGLAERMPGLLAGLFRLELLGSQAARKAVVRPVRAYNAVTPEDRQYGDVEIEPAFVDAVIEQLRTARLPAGDGGEGRSAEEREGIEPSCLQLVMTRIWHHEVETGSRTLWARTLEELGGAAAIVRGHLDRTLGTLAAEDREVCTRALPHLVTPSGAKIACSVTDLVAPAGVAAERLEALLSRLADPDMRILARLPPSLPADEPRYALCHDQLAAALLSWRRRYGEETKRHELAAEANRQRAELAKERRAARHLRWLAAALATAAVLAVALSVWLLTQTSRGGGERLAGGRPEPSPVRAQDAARADAEELEEQLNEANARILRLQGKIGTHTQQLRQLEEERDAAVAEAARAAEQLSSAGAESAALRELLDDLQVALGIDGLGEEEDLTVLIQERLKQLEREQDLLFEQLARERARQPGARREAPPARRGGLAADQVEALRRYLDRDPWGAFAELARRRVEHHEGMALIARAVEHLGGSSVVDDVASIDSRARGLYFGSQRDAVGRLLLTSADMLYLELDGPTTNVIQVVHGKEGFRDVNGVIEEVPPAEIRRQLKPLIENPVALLRQRAEEGFFAAAVGPGEIAGRTVEVVEVETAGRMFRLGVDPDDGRIWSLSFLGENDEGHLGVYEKIYSDHRMVEGKMEVPFATVITFDGERVFDLTFEAVKLDGLIDTKPLAFVEESPER